jgi:hypothetical protein
VQPIDESEILSLGEYEKIRDRFRGRVIEEKRARRVILGDHFSALFENHDTALLQVQEMLRTERITAKRAVLHEIETYNELVPGKDQLSLTFYVEILDKDLRDRMLVELAGLEDHIALEVDGRSIAAKGKRPEAEPGRTTAVHYLKIDLPPDVADALRAKKAIAALVVDHPRSKVRAELGRATLAAIADDLAG